MEQNIDIIEVILANFKASTNHQERIKFHLESHRSECKHFISNHCGYKDKVLCINALYKEVRMDLLSAISAQMVENM